MRFLNRCIIGENREKKSDSGFLVFELLIKKNDMDNLMDSKNNL